MKGNKMNYMKVETVSLVNFASILMDDTSYKIFEDI